MNGDLEISKQAANRDWPDSTGWKAVWDNLRWQIHDFDHQHPVINQALLYGSLGLGLGAGAGVYRELKDALHQRKKQKDRNNPKISPDTIVIRIPRKPIEKISSDCCSVAKVTDLDSSYDIPVTKKNESSDKPRDTKGRFAPKLSKKAGNPNDPWIKRIFKFDKNSRRGVTDPGANTRADMIIASLGAGIGGFYLADAISNKIQERRLKKQIEAAQQSYFDLIDGNSVKNAEFVNNVFMLKDRKEEKTAATGMIPITRWVSGLKDIPATAIAGWNLTALTSAYLTKKFLEDRFGKKEDKDEKPRKVTRIVFKTDPPVEAGEKLAESRKIEISPEVALCAIQLMKEAMEDERMKKFASPNANETVFDTTPPTMNQPSQQANPWSDLHGGLDWILAQNGGAQWIIDKYAQQQGFQRDTSMLPGGRSMAGVALGHLNPWLDKEHTLGVGEGRALLKLQNGDADSMSAAKSYMLSKFKENPEQFLTALGDKRNADFVNSMAMKGVNSMFDKGGRFERLGRIPVLGNIARTMTGYFARNTGWAKRMGMQSVLPGILGKSQEQVNNLLNKYDFHGGGNGWSLKPQTAAAPKPAPAPAPIKKTGSFLGDALAISSRSKIISDTSNDELSKKIDSIAAAGKKKQDKKTDVQASDPAAAEYVDSNKDKIKTMIRVLEERGYVD